ncbi:MAG: glycosyltransferase family 4 protein [Lachnospiraceae bacterium]|nr:glycosyltransferase family 4 protein [Lachnospiraceae bacterium]
MNILIDGQTLETPEVNRGIGVYIKNTLNYMVKLSITHHWYIAVSDRSCLLALDPWVAKQLIPIEKDIFAPTTDYSLSEAYTRELEVIVEEKHIDVFWCPNPLMVNVLFLTRELSCRMYATLYDLIPLIMPPQDWSDEVRVEYLRRVRYLAESRVELLAISSATKSDFIQRVRAKSGIHVTLLAADSCRFYEAVSEKRPDEEAVIVFTGGFDYRKNMDGALAAFGKAKRENPDNKLLQTAKLYLVCSASEEKKEEFYVKANHLGIRENVVITGYISDRELADLYRRCDLFFFPSLYEGFGLPILEAMLSGAYVLSADNSSLPEVCGGYCMLCHAEDIEDMAEKLVDALEISRSEPLSEKQKRQAYAMEYSWEGTARRTLAVLELEDTCENNAAESGNNVTSGAWQKQIERKKQFAELIHHRGEILIGCMGFGLSGRRMDTVIRALHCLIHEAYLVKLVMLGKKDEMFINRICEAGLSEYVCELPCEGEKDVLIGAELTDIVLDMQDLIVGKTTSEVCALMRTGKPMIVLDSELYQKYPDEVCWKVPEGELEAQVLTALIKYLIEQPEMRAVLGGNAETCAEWVLCPTDPERR